jgi:hypothetical protein
VAPIEISGRPTIAKGEPFNMGTQPIRVPLSAEPDDDLILALQQDSTMPGVNNIRADGASLIVEVRGEAFNDLGGVMNGLESAIARLEQELEADRDREREQAAASEKKAEATQEKLDRGLDEWWRGRQRG